MMKQIQEKIRVLKHYLKKWHLSVSIIVLFFLFDSLFIFNLVQKNYPILGLRFEGTAITSLSQKALVSLVQKKITDENTPLILIYQKQVFHVYPTEVGYTSNPSQTTQALLAFGRHGPFFQRIVDQVGALFGFEDVMLSGTVSKPLLTVKVLAIQDEVNQKPIPIQPDFLHDVQKTLPAIPGIEVNSQALADSILHTIAHPKGNVITVPVSFVQPAYHAVTELDPLRKQAIALTQMSISIISGGEVLTLSSHALRQMVTIVERPDPQNLQKTKLVLRLNDTLLNQQLDAFAARVEAKTHAEFDDEDAHALIYGQFYFGTRQLALIPTGGLLQNPHVLGAQTVTGPKIAYLTFDDGPNTIYHPLILDILRQYHVKATFFLIGENVLAASAAAKQTYLDGHLIGNHTYTHSFLPNYSSLFILNELAKTNTVLQGINGNQKVTFFRPPYGGINSVVISAAHQLGLRVFLWDVDPRDWTEPSTDVLVKRVVAYVHQGSNVLLHSNHEATVRALPTILQTLLAEGYTFKTLDAYTAPEEL